MLSDRALRQLSRLQAAYAAHQRETGCEATLPELVRRSGVDEQQLANLIAADRPARGLEQPLHGEEGTVGTFGELMADPLAEDEYEQVITRIAASQVRDLLSGLSDRERMVLGAHLGDDVQTAQPGGGRGVDLGWREIGRVRKLRRGRELDVPRARDAAHRGDQRSNDET